MKFLEQFRADLKQATEDHQRALVLEALRRRADGLTFGDLQALLASQYGKGLGDVKVASLFTRDDHQPRARVRQQTAKSSPRRQLPTSTKKTKKKRVSQKTLDTVTKLLTSAGKFLSADEVVEKSGLHRRTVLRALQQLREAGTIQVSKTSGKPSRATPATPPATKAGDTKLDASIAEFLLAARGQPTSSTDLQKATAAPLGQVRDALKRLVAAGRVRRTGKHRFTRYFLNQPTE